MIGGHDFRGHSGSARLDAPMSQRRDQKGARPGVIDEVVLMHHFAFGQRFAGELVIVLWAPLFAATTVLRQVTALPLPPEG